MRIINDIFFANVSGSPSDNHYLDLYLPDKYEVTKNGRSATEQDGGLDDLQVSLTTSDPDSDLEPTCTDINNDNVYCKTYKSYNESNSVEELKDTVAATEVPLVIFVHGGGWRRGGRQAWTHYLYFDVNFLVVLFTLLVGTYKNVGQALASSGIACAVISYPLTEAGPLCLLAELCLSYIQSCLAMFLASVPVLAILFVEFGASLSSGHLWWTQLEFHRALSLKTYILIIMLVTNLMTTCLLSVKRREFRLKTYHIRTLWFCMVAGNITIFIASENKLLLSVILSFLANQFIILKLRLSRCGGCYEDQTKVLAKAVRWAKTAGKHTDMFDASQVYLMGHSAGGHLVSLTALDDGILAVEGCSHKDIKGVVSLSGVYDLMCLCGPFLRPFYLQPTFGHSQTTWLRASPSHLMKRKTQKDYKTRPKFLLMVAENDLFLKQQSRRFSEILQQAEVDCRHIEVLGTNHFTIVTNLMKTFTGNDKSVLAHIMHFVLS